MAKVETNTQQESPLAKSMKRTGACIQAKCQDVCGAFAFTKVMDGFRTCVCGHTQHSHAFGKATQ